MGGRIERFNLNRTAERFFRLLVLPFGQVQPAEANMRQGIPAIALNCPPVGELSFIQLVQLRIHITEPLVSWGIFIIQVNCLLIHLERLLMLSHAGQDPGQAAQSR